MAKRRVTQGQVGKTSTSIALGKNDPRYRRGYQGGAVNEEILAGPIGLDRDGKLTLRPVARVKDATDETVMETTNSILKALRDAGILES